MTAKRIAIGVAAAAAVCAGVNSAVAPATTTPGVIYVVKVTLTNSAITIPKDKFSLHTKYPRLPRGAQIRYEILNKGTRPYSFKIWGSTTGVMKARVGKDAIFINWTYRGKFLYETLYKGKPAGPKGYVTVF
ncbi:MAG TPA: hypothetical protein VGL75_10455 [Acidothermaceae bacterium]